MSAPMASSSGRVVFLDNLRWFFVLCVVMEHACNAYRGLDWWPVADSSISLAVIFFSTFFDSFTMPLLFFVSGYFALPSIQKKGPAVFLKGKLKRLGAPWLVCILTVCPILPLVYHYTRDGFTLTKSYGSLWLELMNNALGFEIGLIPSMNELMMNNWFYQRYMWFLSLLILMFFIFAACYKMKKNWFDAEGISHPDVQQGIWPTIKLFLAVGFLTTFFSFAMIGVIIVFGPKSSGPEPLFTLGNIIQFRPSRIFFFLIYFALGVLTYRNKWISRGKFPGQIKTWCVLFVLLLSALLIVRYLMIHGPQEFKDLYGPAYFLVMNFLTISTLGFFSSIAFRFWNKTTAFGRDMASHSYNIYLGHYIFVIGLQLILISMPNIPGLVKFGLVSIASFVLSYCLSRMLLKPFPKASIGFAFVILIIMVLAIRP